MTRGGGCSTGLGVGGVDAVVLAAPLDVVVVGVDWLGVAGPVGPVGPVAPVGPVGPVGLSAL